jgi:hypothetical protein
LFLLFESAHAGQLDTSVAIEAVKRKVVDCKECVYFALPTQSRFVREHKLFFVSTVDRIPPPYWTVGLEKSKSAEAYFLDAKNLSDWNRMFQKERISLSKDADLVEFAKSFLDLAVGRALFILELNALEKDRIRQKVGKDPISSLKIVRDKERFRLQFYAKDVGGALQQWDLIVLKNGRIEKADVRDF